MNSAMKGAAMAAGVLVGASAVAQPAAVCPAGTVRQFSIAPLVNDKTMCAVRGADRWQEYHAPNKDLIDWKLGAGHPIDPTKKVGIWAALDGNAAPPNVGSNLIHSYPPGPSFAWLVCRESSGTSYTLVSTSTAGTITGVTLLNGQQPCP